MGSDYPNQMGHEFWREYIAEVVEVEDPKKMMRVQVLVYDIFDGVPKEDLPWAIYKLPTGVRAANGGIIPVQKGDKVWVDFPFGGDTRRPRIVAGMHFVPEGFPDIPHESWAGPEQVEHKRLEHEPEPTKPVYHKDVVFKQHEILLQITEKNEFMVTHLKSGSAIRISSDGVMTIHSEKDLFASSPTKLKLQVGGSTLEMTPDKIALKSPLITLN